AIKSMAFIIGDGDIFDGLTQTKLSYGWLNRSRVAITVPTREIIFMVLLKEALYVPLALSLAMTQIRNERAGDARRTRFLNRCSTETVGFEPILLKDVQH